MFARLKILLEMGTEIMSLTFLIAHIVLTKFIVLVFI